ncbi:hypothetical protein COCNU_scaffold005094G000010 [Cocos nucifera]|nr:hypothetical protein [Cocos nucifera]
MPVNTEIDIAIDFTAPIDAWLVYLILDIGITIGTEWFTISMGSSQCISSATILFLWIIILSFVTLISTGTFLPNVSLVLVTEVPRNGTSLLPVMGFHGLCLLAVGSSMSHATTDFLASSSGASLFVVPPPEIVHDGNPVEKTLPKERKRWALGRLARTWRVFSDGDEQEPADEELVAVSSKANLSSKSLAAMSAIKMYLHHDFKTITYSLSSNEIIINTFDSVIVTWTFRSIYGQDTNSCKSRSDLHFHYKHHAKVHAEYVPFLLSQASAMQFKNQERKLCTNQNFDSSRML